MSSWRLSKYLKMKFIKRGQIRRKLFVINFTEKFIEDFAEFMKIKAYDDKEFKKKARELLKNVN